MPALVAVALALAPIASARGQARAPERPEQRGAIEWTLPSAMLTWTSGTRDSREDGAAFTGTGLDVALRAALRARLGALRIQFAPEIHAQQNTDHAFFASGDPARDPVASPFYHGAFSADLPSRPGLDAFTRVMPGESAIWLRQRGFLAALTSTTPRWGPDIDVGEGLVLGRSAPGLPRAELALERGAAGTLRLRWFGGVARESAWFDDDASNDWRTVAGLRVEHEHRIGITTGLSRTVMTAGDRGHADGLLLPFARARRAISIEMVALDLTYADERRGTRAWIELARQAPIVSASSLLRAPTDGLAYRLGVRQVIAEGDGVRWTAALEHVRFEQSGTREDPEPRDLYTSPIVPQGWTHLGQPLGSGIGPGGQRQYAALHREGPIWRLRAFLERVRWNENAMLREPLAASDRHDVTLQGGLGLGRRVRGYDVEARVGVGRRLNYLFQGASVTPDAMPVDLRLMRIGLSIAPAPRSSRIVADFPRP